MKTTLDLPDDLLAEAKAMAARRRTTLKAIMEHALRREIFHGKDAEGSDRAARVYEVDDDGFPSFKSRGGNVTSDKIYEMLDEEDV